MNKRFFLIYLLVLFVFPLSAQQVKIGGTVTDEKGEPLEMAIVRIEGTAIGTSCNLKGKYSLKFSSKDTVTVVFSMIGFNTRKKKLVHPSGNISINMQLPPLGYEIGQVTITGTRRQMNTVQQLDIKASKLMPDASGGNLESMLTTQAGVSSNNELSSQYNVRGGSFDENMVYVNGVEIYRPLLIRSGQQEGLSFINPEMVKNVGFSTGGYEARFGDKMSSVLDITYKQPEHFEATAQASLLGASAYVGLGSKKFSWINSFRYKSNRYLLGTLDTKGEYNPRYTDYQTYLTWKPNKRWEFGFIGNISENKYSFQPQDRNTRFGTLSSVREFKVYFDGQEQDLFRTYFGSGNITFHPTEAHSITFQASAFRTKEQETYDISGEYWLSDLDENAGSTATSTNQTSGVGAYKEHARNYLTANVQSFSLKGSSKFGKKHTVLWGLEMKHEHIKDDMREWEFRDSAGYSLPQVIDGPQLIYTMTSKNDINSNRYSFYAQDSYRFESSAGIFTLTAGMRGSYWDWNKEFIFSPRASLALIPKFNDKFTFRFATGVYYQAPFYKEFRDTTMVNGVGTVTLNKDIRSQRSIHFVLGADYGFRALNRPFKLSAELYYKALSNLIPYNIDNVRISYYGRNLSSGYATGIDLKLFGEFVPETDSWLSLSIMQTKEKLYGKWIPRPTDQAYNLSLYFTDYFPGSKKWKMNLKATFAGGLPFGPPHSGLEGSIYRTPPYRRVDIGMSRVLIDNSDKPGNHAIKNMWLGVDVFNLLNINNVNSYYWVTDVRNNQFAVPNYLTSRQINLRLLLEF